MPYFKTHSFTTNISTSHFVDKFTCETAWRSQNRAVGSPAFKPSIHFRHTWTTEQRQQRPCRKVADLSPEVLSSHSPQLSATVFHMMSSLWYSQQSSKWYKELCISLNSISLLTIESKTLCTVSSNLLVFCSIYKFLYVILLVRDDGRTLVAWNDGL